MLWVLLPFVFGIALSQYFTLPLIYPSLLFLVAGVALIFSQRIFLTYIMIFSIGFILPGVNSCDLTSYDCHDATFVVDLEGQQFAHILAQQHSSSAQSEMNSRVLLRRALSDTLHWRQIVCRGDLKPIDPSNGSYYKSLYHKGYRNVLTVNNIVSCSERPAPPLPLRLNALAMERLERLGLRDESFASAAAMGLARRDFLGKELSDAYARSGTAHLLALSGLHLGIVVLIISFVCYFLPLLHRGHIVADVISIVAIWLFALVAGLGDSILRAAWMFTFLQLASLLSRRYSSLNSLFAAAMMILIFDPLALFDLGFRLSFVAVAAIIIFGVPLVRWLHSGLPVVDFLVASFVIGGVATLATAPLISHAFGYISLLSPVATAPLLLTLSAIVIATILWVVLPLSLFAPIFGTVIEYAATIQNYIVRCISSWGYGFIDYRISEFGLNLSYLLLFSAALLVMHFYEDRR